MEHVDKTITSLLLAAEICEKKVIEFRRIAEQLGNIFREDFKDRKPDKDSSSSKSSSKRKRVVASPKSNDDSKKSSRKGSRNPFSKYKGVTRNLSKKNPFRASAYIDGRNKSLGVFSNELEAAAVAADARGEKDLATQLLAQILKEKADGRSKLKTYICKHCGFKIDALKAPFQCTQCNSAAFKEKEAKEG